MAKVQHTVTGCVPIDRSVVEAYSALITTNQAATVAEDDRQEAEGQGDYSDTTAYPNTRRAKEAARQAAEAERVINEGSDGPDSEGYSTSRIKMELDRQSAETQRQINEGIGATDAECAAGSRRKNESIRQSNEATRQSNEATRQAQEGTPSDEASASGSRWARYKYAEASRDTSYGTAEGEASDEASASGSRWARYKYAEAARETAYNTAEAARDAAMAPIAGYYACSTAAATAAKEVAATNYVLTNGGTIKVKFTYANSATSPTLNINSTGAKAIVYNGAIASATNTWAAGDVVEFYYDPTYNSNAGAFVGIPTMVTVSQNTSTGHTDINIGSNSYPVASVGELSDKTGEIREISNITEANLNAFVVQLKQGDGFYWKITGTFSRVIINYNGSNSNRLIDSNSVEVVSGTWYYSVVPANISQLGIWLTGTDATGLTFAIRMFNKSYLDAAPELYGKFNLQEKKYVGKGSINLFDYSKRTPNTILGSNGLLNEISGFYTSDYIPVYAGKMYSFRGYVRRGILFDSYKRAITSTYVDNPGHWQFTPTVDGFMRFSAGDSGTDYTVIESSTAPTEYIPYKEKIQENVFLSESLKSEILELLSDGELEIEISSPLLIFKCGENQIKATLNIQESATSLYDTNPVFNFVEYTYNGHTQITDDDVAPLHIFGTTLGANHGQPCQKLTISGHGLTNADVGKYMTLSGTSEKYYIVRIVDANNIWALGEDTSSDPSAPTFRTISGSTATLTMGGATYNVTAIASAQMRPMLKNASQKVLNEKGEEINTDGTYRGAYFDVVETYDIMYVPSVLANLISRVGTTTDPEYDGDSALTVKNVYRFLPNLSVLVFATIIPRMSIKFADAMFTQAIRIGGLTTTKYYLPGSVPGSNYDLTRPVAVPFGSGYPSISVSKNNHWPDASTPVDRVLQFTTEHGLALGIIPGIGVGKNIVGFTDQTFEIRGTSGKVYPHPVNYAVVRDLAVGKIYNAGMFRAFIPNGTMDSDTIGIYGYELNGSYYLYAEFANSVIKEIPVSHKYDGRNVEIIKSVNCQLLTDICNGGITISATAITGETSCIVVKI